MVKTLQGGFSTVSPKTLSVLSSYWSLTLFTARVDCILCPPPLALLESWVEPGQGRVNSSVAALMPGHM